MTGLFVDQEPAHDESDISFLALGSVLLRRRRGIFALALFGASVGLAAGLLSTRKYSSTATFIPQGSEGGTSQLALAASQFGIRVPTAGSGWGPPIYVELLRSRALLEPIALDTLAVAEEAGRRVAVMDLLRIEPTTSARRTVLAIRALQKVIAAGELKPLGAVKVSVTTPWPSVSLALAERLVRGVNEFNLKTRKSQALAERQFVDAQASTAEHALREAEDRLQLFLQRNRAISGSPELGFERDRLQREVALRQQIYTSLLQNREEARIREVRDTPVITVIEDPKLAVVGEARNTARKATLGGLIGGALGLLAALFSQRLSRTRQKPSDEAEEFFRLVEEATPRFLRGGTR